MRNKYRATRTADGFPSKLESAVYQLLLLREKAGEIRNISRQTSVELWPKRRWKVDFGFDFLKCPKTNLWVQGYAEAKGMSCERYIANVSFWRAFPQGRLEIWKGSYKNPYLDEVIE